MKKVIEYQNENECVIHQDVARMRGRLTTVQSRSMLSILKRANEQIEASPEIKEFIIPTDVFLNDITTGTDTRGVSTIVSDVAKHLEKLMVQIFEWGTAKEINKCIFMQQIKVTNEQVTFKFSDYIHNHLKPLSNALIVKDFALIQSFRSEYARQLYKHLMMWEQKQSLYLTVQDLKDFLGVPKTKSYERMNNLKAKVLDVAVAEINEKCPWMDLQYTNRTKPRSKTIEGFNFGWFNERKEVVKEDKQGTLKGTEFNKNLEQFIGKRFYKDGYDYKIKSISTNGKLYSAYCYDIDRPSDTKHFEFSIEQLKQFKD